MTFHRKTTFDWPKYERCVSLARYGALSQSEIAEALETDRGTVSRYIQRAIQAGEIEAPEDGEE